MKTILLHLLLLASLSASLFGQNLSQTVRGTLIDNDSKLPLIGATLLVVGSNPILGTSTDAQGNFRLEKVPVGRITLQISYLGYETKTFPNLIVNSGKEVFLDLTLEESAIKMNEVTINANKNKGEALNEMSLISSRSISVEESKRYAGGFDDPSRVVTNFAGATSTPDGSSDIIVRGNSPKYLQWRLEGTEISSPYHFDDQNSTFGGLSALNNNLLTASDFYTGAFAPEYGSVLSSIMDIKLRTGNNEKFESTFGFGLLGTDISIEGPFKYGYGGSFLINYRYSTAAVLTQLGLIDIGGTPKYQDVTFKLVLPTQNAGTFSVFGVAGINGMVIEDLQPSILGTPGNKTGTADYREDINKQNHLLNLGVNHTYTLNKSSYLKTSVSLSSNGISDDIFESKVVEINNSDGEYLNDSITNRKQNFKNRFDKTIYRASVTYNNKLNSKNKIQIGTKYAHQYFSFNQSMLFNDTSEMFTVVDFLENAGTLTGFVSWKHNLTENITIVSGIHHTNVLLNNKYTIEPRVALNWQLNNTNSIHAGYGMHSTMESIHHYFSKVETEPGTSIEPNRDLDLLKAHHYVLGYENRFTDNLMAKIEVYYQQLYDLPVENNDTSYFATINEGLDYKYVDLVNEGTGENYGVELSLERFFNKNYFFMVNTSLFNSTYKTLEGIERNTRYNSKFLCNVLVGKEVPKLGKKENQTLSVNTKLFFGGGQKYIPLLKDDQGNLAVDKENNKYWDYSKAYDKSLDNIYYINLSLSYKFNKPKATHEIFLDLQNLTNYKGRIYEYYDESEPNSIGYYTQMGFFPNLMYRVYF